MLKSSDTAVIRFNRVVWSVCVPRVCLFAVLFVSVCFSLRECVFCSFMGVVVSLLMWCSDGVRLCERVTVGASCSMLVACLGFSLRLCILFHSLFLPLILSPLFSRSLYVFLILSHPFLCSVHPFSSSSLLCCVVSVAHVAMLRSVMLCELLPHSHSFSLALLCPALLVMRFTH